MLHGLRVRLGAVHHNLSLDQSVRWGVEYSFLIVGMLCLKVTHMCMMEK